MQQFNLACNQTQNRIITYLAIDTQLLKYNNIRLIINVKKLSLINNAENYQSSAICAFAKLTKI